MKNSEISEQCRYQSTHWPIFVHLYPPWATFRFELAQMRGFQWVFVQDAKYELEHGGLTSGHF